MSTSLLLPDQFRGARSDRKADPIHVTVALDHHFARGAAVTMRSLLDNTSERERIQIHVLDTGLTAEDRDRLQASWWGTAPPEFHDISETALEVFKGVPIASHVTAAGFARLLMPELFPDIEEMWWFDSDLIVQGNFVDEIHKYPTDGKPIAAAVNNATPRISCSRGVRNWQATDLDPNGPYLQSGFGRWHLGKLRAMGFTDIVREVAERYRNVIGGGDQEILNRIFGQRLGESEPGWAPFPDVWNDVEVHMADLGRLLPHDRIRDNPLRLDKHGRGAITLANEAKIIHVTEVPKVWDAEYWGTVVLEIFNQYEARTAWRGAERLSLGGRGEAQREYVEQVTAQSVPGVFLY